MSPRVGWFGELDDFLIAKVFVFGFVQYGIESISDFSELCFAVLFRNPAQLLCSRWLSRQG
jgi:hypothetical protein